MIPRNFGKPVAGGREGNLFTGHQRKFFLLGKVDVGVLP